jgi:DNA-binding transcriptional ArsR family regulator
MAIVHTCSISVKQMNNIETIPQGPDLATIDVLTVLQALSDPVRLEIVRQLAENEDGRGLRCHQLRIPVSKSTGSHHLKTLSKAGITVEQAEGTSKFLRLRRDELEQRFPGLLDSVLQATDR